MKSTKPVVEVVILSYNYGKYISAALESVLTQKQDNFTLRVTVADDRSTDDTSEVVSGFVERYPESVRVLSTDRNRGCLGNTLHAFENLNCDYFCLLDADDLWVGDTKLMRQVQFLEENPDYSMCAGMTVRATEERIIGQIGTGVARTDTFGFDDFISGKGFFVHTSSILYRNLIYRDEVPRVYYDALGTYKECAYRGEDWRFLEHLQRGPIKVFNDVFSIYRFHSEGLWQGSSELKRKVESLISALVFSEVLGGTDKGYFQNKFKEYCAPLGSMLAEGLITPGNQSDSKALFVLGELLSDRSASLRAPLTSRAVRKAPSTPALSANPILFDGDDSMFKRVVSQGIVYGEYGCGLSTIWVARHMGCEILSVDSSVEWAQKVNSECEFARNVRVHFADVGPVGPWGTPLGYEKLENFSEYTDWIWKRPMKPDVVLVDGRFRVCCFLTSLMHGEVGTKIIFDDYRDRPQYHLVEKFVKPIDTCGRQALFEIPTKSRLDLDELKVAIGAFRCVFD